MITVKLTPTHDNDVFVDIRVNNAYQDAFVCIPEDVGIHLTLLTITNKEYLS